MAFISNYESMDDSSEQIEIPINEGDDLLIDLVGERPWLYDKATKGYSDQIMTYNAWKDISIIMNDTVENCKTHWQKLLDHYSREKLSTDKETRSGAAASNRRSWPFFQRIQSLLQKNTHKFSNPFTNVASTPAKTQYPQKCFTDNKQNKKSNNKHIDVIQSVFNNCSATMRKIEKQLHDEPNKQHKPVDNPDELFRMLIESELNGMDQKIAKEKRKLLMRLLSELDSDSD